MNLSGKRKKFVAVLSSTVLSTIVLTGCGSPSASVRPVFSTHTVSNTHVEAARQADTKTNASDGQALQDDGQSGLPAQIDSSIPDNAQIVGKSYARLDDGSMVRVSDGSTVTNREITGTDTYQPDPLARSDGHHFEPVSAGEIREQQSQQQSSSGSTSNESAALNQKIASNKAAMQRSQRSITDAARTKHRVSSAIMTERRDVSSGNSQNHSRVVQTASRQGNSWGAYWGTSGGSAALFSASNSPVITNAHYGIDVSQWQGSINWSAVKADGVEFAIIRAGWGSTGIDPQAANNIAQCRRLGIPFGVYLYSYASNATEGRAEADHLANMLFVNNNLGSDAITYPIYYDLENWSYGSYSAPTSAAQWQGIVDAWWQRMNEHGYHNLGVYSFSSYLSSALNSSDIHSKTSWVASYGANVGYSFSTSVRGWQYSDAGKVNGIAGNVDLDGFTLGETFQMTWIVRPEDIAVGLAVGSGDYSRYDYRFMSYNVSSGKWTTIKDWNNANWGTWDQNTGVYWLHSEVRDRQSGLTVSSITIPFDYKPGYGRITGTYAGTQNNHTVLLGESSDNPHGHMDIKIYDYLRKEWVAEYSGPWATWKPTPGIYWTHYELYTSSGKLQDTRTYAFAMR